MADISVLATHALVALERGNEWGYHEALYVALKMDRRLNNFEYPRTRGELRHCLGSLEEYCGAFDLADQIRDALEQ